MRTFYLMPKLLQVCRLNLHAMKFCNLRLIIISFIFLGLYGCSKDSVKLDLPTPAQYADTLPGRILIYRLDSTLIPSSGSTLRTKSYHAKDSIGASFIDVTGNISYPIFRFVTDTLELGSWQYISSYMVTLKNKTVETIDDANNRFISLISPIENDATWKGNKYLETESAESPIRYLSDWDYTYQNVNMPFAVAGENIDSTITVLQRDETTPEGPFDPDFFKQRNYSIEVYAKGVGLVYKDFLHWTWQVDPAPARYENDSYGIRLSLISYR